MTPKAVFDARAAAVVASLRRLLGIPTAPSEQEDRLLGILVVITTAVAIVAAAALVVLLVAPAGVSAHTPPIVALMIVLAAASLALLRRGLTTAASTLTFGSLLGSAAALLALGEGIHDISILLLPVVLLFGGLFFSLRHFGILVAITMLVLGSVALAELNGLVLSLTPPATTAIDVVMAILVLSVSAFAVALLSRNLLDSLALASDRERQLLETNRALADREQDRSRLIQELERRNEELERFTYTVSHDLKSPVVTIRGFLGYIRADARAGRIDRMDEDLSRVADATSKMLDLLEDLLALSRVGRLVRPPEEVPFGEIVSEALELVRGRLAAGNVTVSVEEGLPLLHCDRARLVEVVQNLVDNAAKFMGGESRPQIEIGCRRQEGDETVLFVRDNGIGIDPVFHDRVFGLFDQIDNRVEGTGIGLALVKRIVEVHGGRIWVESEGVGRGSTFVFALPATAVARLAAG